MGFWSIGGLVSLCHHGFFLHLSPTEYAPGAIFSPGGRGPLELIEGAPMDLLNPTSSSQSRITKSWIPIFWYKKIPKLKNLTSYQSIGLVWDFGWGVI